MKRKIIGNTVGMGLPKPNLMQTDPSKGDFVKGKEEFLKQAGNGTNIDADWIATKELTGGDTVYIPEQKVSGGLWNNLQMSLQPGFAYDVTFNGEVYTCEARADGQGVALGNNTSMSLNDYPFCISWAGGSAISGMFFKRSDISYPITLKVTDHAYYVYDRLPEEYLPDCVVKSVNGKRPYANGNVEIPTGTVTNEQIASAVEDYMAEHPVIHGAAVEPAEDDIPKVFIDGVIPTTSDYVLAEIRYISKSDTFHAYLEIKCQGRSSMSYAKKNFTIKMYSDEARETKLKKSFKDWGYEKNKYVLKANFVDHTHARNIVSARLWDEIVASRSDYGSLPEELRTSPRNGAIDGFPVKVYTNGTYQGIYTWNIGKDDWMWNMDEDNPNHFLLCGETNTNGKFAETPCNFRKLWGGADGADWTVEVGTNGTNVTTCLNNLIGFVMDNDGDAFREGIGNYLDVQSAIDYYILAYVICALDNLGSNVLLGTYDGKILRYGAYDLDSTFGNWYTGGSFVSADYKCPENYQEPFNLLFERIEANFRDELKTRYAELRESVLSFYNMVTHFERFMDVIGLDLYAEDAAIYNIPNAKNKDIKQLRDFIRDRLAYTDAEFAAMIDPIPCTGISLSASTMAFTSEGTQTLTATVEPTDTTDAVTWESSNISVAIVSDGVVTAVANGSAVITARCGNCYASCAVSVSGIFEAVPCTGIALSATSIELNVDAESGMQGIHTLVATLTPEDTTDILSWNSSNPNVATVEGGVVTAIAEGDATITATCGNYSASCSVAVSAQEVAPLYPLENGSYSFSQWETTVTATTAENGHVKLDYSNNTYAATLPIDNINTITNVKGHSNSSRTAPIFTFPAGSTARMIVKNLAYTTEENTTDLNTSVFLWDSSKKEKKFFGNITKGATEADGTLTFEEEFPVYALVLWQSKFIGTVEFDIELYVDGVRWI